MHSIPILLLSYGPYIVSIVELITHYCEIESAQQVALSVKGNNKNQKCLPLQYKIKCNFSKIIQNVVFFSLMNQITILTGKLVIFIFPDYENRNVSNSSINYKDRPTKTLDYIRNSYNTSCRTPITSGRSYNFTIMQIQQMKKILL